MKKYAVLASTLLALTLTACGDKKQHVYAVDAVEVAQANAIANAPKAEPIKFDDEGTAPPAPASEAPAKDANTATATAEAPATTAPADTASAPASTTPAETAPATDANTATATAEAPATDKK